MDIAEIAKNMTDASQAAWQLVLFLTYLFMAIQVAKLVKRSVKLKREKVSVATGPNLEKYHDATVFKVRHCTAKQRKPDAGTVAVLTFDGDVMASGRFLFGDLVDEVIHNKEKFKEVVVRIQSPGGAAHTYGHVSDLMVRMRKAGVNLTACVDDVAASGGYLSAVPANKILAASFALMGSVGVVAETLNFHDLLNTLNIKSQVFTAGKWKRTVTTTGKDTPEGEAKFQEQMVEIHEQFFGRVIEYRGDRMSDAAKAEIREAGHWSAAKSVELGLGLVDGISTSSEYLMELNREMDLVFINKKKDYTLSFMERLATTMRTHLVMPVLQYLLQERIEF